MTLRNSCIIIGRNILLNQQKTIVLSANTQFSTRNKKTIAKLHVTPIRKYPEAKPIPVPENLDGLQHAETARWSPHRTRDINTPAILCHASSSLNKNKVEFQTPLVSSKTVENDPHVDSYDCTGAVSLNSSMQTNVPEPYQSGSKSTHLNMPGGQWESGNKFIAEDMRSSHYVNTVRRSMSSTADDKMSLSTSEKKSEPAQLSKKEQLKRAFKEYGSVIVVFHVTISLASLGICYLVISSGLDVTAILTYVGLGENPITTKIAAGTGTFVAAYALHKLFVPARMSLTLACTPFIVRYLRKVGYLKPPSPQ